MGPPRAPLPTPRVRRPAIRGTVLLLLGLAPAACTTSAPSVPRYIVTATPLNLVGLGHPGGLQLLASILLTHRASGGGNPDRQGGAPSAPPAQRFFARTSQRLRHPQCPSEIDVRFQLPLISGPRDVSLLVLDGTMRVAGSDERVSTGRRDDLDIPPFHGP